MSLSSTKRAASGALVLIAAAALTTATASAATHAAVPRPDHIVVLIDENHAQGEIVGSPDAPYITALSQQGANFTNSHAITHPSQPNYLALFSGSAQGVTNDTCPKKAFTTADLGGETLAANLTFAGYSESMPSDGYTGCTSGSYARKHNPWVDFADVPAADNLTFKSFPTDYTKLPAVSFVVPNLDNDMHDGTVAQGDSWLKQNLDGYVQWAKTHNSVFVLTFDEDDNGPDNQIPTIITGAGVTTGDYSENISHYSVLRTIEDAYGLPHAGQSASATPITDIWG
jgi:phospholipase C